MRRFAFCSMCAGTLLGAVFMIAAAKPRNANAPNSAASSVRVGEVNFPTSCTAAAQPLIETAVALLHSFQYEEADQTFSRAAKEDPKCAMAHWGKAMSRYEQLWEFPKGRTVKSALEDVQRAETLGAATDRERGYIAAAAAFYRSNSKAKHADRIKEYSTALARLREKFPDDVDAAAFYALSFVALAEDGDDAAANRTKAIAILQPLCRVAPNNPGPAHYLIHAADTPEFAPQGLDAARSYAKIAPDSSHALHMPSHIFVRLGLWEESIQSNIAAAAAAAKATEEHRATPHYQFHAMDFLNYSYLQSGDESKARQVVEQMDKVPGTTAEDIADHKAYVTARIPLELHRWKEAASLAIPDVKKDWQESTYRVRTIGAARLGDAAAARKNLERYVELSGAKRKQGADKGVPQLEAEAWVAYAEGKSDEALKTMRSAAEKQDADTMESLVMPAREMLADMLLELRRSAEAVTEYKTALKGSPNRFDSLYGAARAAQLAGESAEAHAFYAKLMEISAPTADRAELAEAKSYLTTASKGK